MATDCRLKTLWISILLITITTSTKAEELEILEESETKDGKLDIIKQIKKVNDDGSYTFGYEAEDGTFKIESRDVLGNIKGTFGYIDQDGEIKRVSYSTSNSTDVSIVTTTVVPTTDVPVTELPSVVQRIPKANRTLNQSTRRPTLVFPSSTANPLSTSSSNVIQTIPRRRPNSQATSGNSINDKSPSSTTVRPSSLFYSTPAALRALQLTTSKSSLNKASSTLAPQAEAQKSEEQGQQIIRPIIHKETVTLRPPQPTELPHLRRLVNKNNLLIAKPELSTVKPVIEHTENPERERVRGNLLRRQLSQEKTSSFDTRQHLLSLQQSNGDDATDVYSGSVTTGTPRPPLFTTTARPSVVTAAPVGVAHRATTARYPLTYQRNQLQLQHNQQDEVTNTEATVSDASVSYTQNPVAVPVVQIPPNKEFDDPNGRTVQVVAARHPYHQGTILVPLHQLRQQGLLPDNPNQPNQYSPPSYYPQIFIAGDSRAHEAQATTTPDPQVQPTPIPIQFITRSPPVALPQRQMHFIPQNPNPVHFTPIQAPYPVQQQRYPIVTARPDDLQNEINQIQPPVSTRDFQKLIQQLILRQNRLEQINALTAQHGVLSPPPVHPQDQVYYPHSNRGFGQRPTTVYLRRHPQAQQREDVAYVAPAARARQYATQPQGYGGDGAQAYPADPQSYVPTRRVARLLNPRHHEANQGDAGVNQENEDYLPPDVREMLLLKMLQLAINPALPLENTIESVQQVTGTAAPTQHHQTVVPQRHPHQMHHRQIQRRIGTRNVEILGEELDEMVEHEPPKRSGRNKRYRDTASDYY